MTDASHPSPPSNAPVPEPKSRATQFRWQIGAAIALLGSLVQTIIWFLWEPDRTYQVMSATIIVPATAFFLLLWWVFACGLRWSTRIKGLGAFALVAIVIALSVRHEGFYGDMLPRLVPRWKMPAEDQAELYWHTQLVAKQSAASSAADQVKPDAALTLQITDADWPQFRGQHRDGIATGVKIRRDWDKHPPKLIWDHAVGLGWSSFAVVEGLAFTQEQRRKNEVVVCYDFETGDQIWVHADEARFSEAMGGVGPRATPTIFDSRVYTLGATGILNCLDARTGSLIWSTNILNDAGAENLSWAMAGSPLVYEDLVVVNPGGGQGRGVTAYDRLTGQIVWAAGVHQAGYAAPRLATIGGIRQVLIFDGDGLAGHEASAGRELWRFAWTNGPKVNAAGPIVVDDHSVFIGCGYNRGSVLLDVRQRNGVWLKPQPRWKTRQSRRLKLKFSGAVTKDGYVYGLDERILTCVDLSNGKVQWKRGRYGYGQIVLVDGVLLIQAESGDVVLVEASPNRHREIARFPALETKTWNHPVVTRGRLLVRNDRMAACYDIRPITEAGGE